jgi:O-antigen ligase
MNSSVRPFFSFEISYLFGLFIILLTGLLIPRLLAYTPAIAGLLFAAGLVLKEKKFIETDKPILLFLSAIIFLSGLSSLWSFNPEFSVERTIKMALIILPSFLFLSVSHQIKMTEVKKFLMALIGLMAATALFFISQKMTEHVLIEKILGYDVASHKLNRAFVVLSLFILPVLYSIRYLHWNKKTKAIVTLALIALTTFALTKTQSQTAQLCFLIGLILLYILPAKKFLVKLFFIGLVILTLSLPFMIKPVKNALPEDMLTTGFLHEASIIHRLEIWEYSVEKMFEKPWLGNGIDSLRFMTANQWMTHQKSDQALHSHNVILQFWVEFGILGAVFLLVFLGLSAKKMLAVDDDGKRRLYFAVYAAAAGCTLTGYGFWQSWHLGLLMFLAAFTVFIGNQNYRDLGSKNQ